MPARVEGHVDVVVVGSGFGGSVTAFRLAEAGRSVCVLERGKPYPPGAFARRPREMVQNIWDPPRGYHGLFDVWTFRGLEAVASSGLGGGSLIYANVLLRKDERWFVHESPVQRGGVENWPISRADLDPHYDRVERMMGVQALPLGAAGYPSPPKTVAMRDAAANLGLEWGLPPLAVTFANPGRPPALAEPIPDGPYPNLHGLPRRTCRLCGECDVGCNEGSKNTLDHTYLSAAKHHGADIRTRCEVHSIERRPEGGYLVGYVPYGPEHEGVKVNTDKLPLTWLSCERVVLAAGTFGSTGLLLRNRSALPDLGPALGTRFCGNGDLLSFILDAHEGKEGTPRRHLDSSLGPVITSYVRVPDTLDGGDGPGYYIEDAGYPIAIDWMLEAITTPSRYKRILRAVLARVISRIRKNPRSTLSTELQTMIGDAVLSSTSLPLLGMGRDVPDGVMRIKRGQLDIDWTTATSKTFFERLRGTMGDIAGELGGELHDNPLWWLKRVITVHPLGGCPMGRGIQEGVVDQYGQSFAYPGLHVVDGSVLPGPVGPNPSLTIAAVADRGADHMLETWSQEKGRVQPVPHVDPVPPAPPDPNRPASGEHVTDLSFTEEMKGFVTFGATDYQEGFDQGKAAGTAFMFHLTITCPDVDRFLQEKDHHGVAVGWVSCDALGGRLPVERGDFNLFVEDFGPRRRHMYYRLYVTDSTGHPLTMTGHKDVRDDAGFDVWTDTSTLYIRLLRGHVPVEEDATAELAASGILRILIPDFARQLTTFRVEGGGAMDRASALASFGKSFLADLWDVFGGRAERDQTPD